MKLIPIFHESLDFGKWDFRDPSNEVVVPFEHMVPQKPNMIIDLTKSLEYFNRTNRLIPNLSMSLAKYFIVPGTTHEIVRFSANRIAQMGKTPVIPVFTDKIREVCDLIDISPNVVLLSVLEPNISFEKRLEMVDAMLKVHKDVWVYGVESMDEATKFKEISVPKVITSRPFWDVAQIPPKSDKEHFDFYVDRISKGRKIRVESEVYDGLH